MTSKQATLAFDCRQTAARLKGDLISARKKVIILAEARMQARRAALANAAFLEDAANLRPLPGASEPGPQELSARALVVRPVVAWAQLGSGKGM